MPGKRSERRGKMGREVPRTDLPPEKEPYYEGYLGTDEEGVVREREDRPREGSRDGGREGGRER